MTDNPDAIILRDPDAIILRDEAGRQAVFPVLSLQTQLKERGFVLIQQAGIQLVIDLLKGDV